MGGSSPDSPPTTSSPTPVPLYPTLCSSQPLSRSETMLCIYSQCCLLIVFPNQNGQLLGRGTGPALSPFSRPKAAGLPQMPGEHVNPAGKRCLSLTRSVPSPFPQTEAMLMSSEPPKSLRLFLGRVTWPVTSFFKDHGPFSRTCCELLGVGVGGRDQGSLISVSPQSRVQRRF